MDEWLKNLKVGDTVIVWGSWGDQIKKITGETKTCFKIGDTLFRKDTGREKTTEKYNAWYLAEATPEAVERIQTNNLRRRVSASGGEAVKKMNRDQLERMMALIKEVQ